MLETVFVALLGREAGTSQVIAALLAFRAVYYLLPLLVALVLWAAIEWHVRRIAVQPPSSS